MLFRVGRCVGERSRVRSEAQEQAFNVINRVAGASKNFDANIPLLRSGFVLVALSRERGVLIT
jgi:hypothetical protein